MFEDKSSQLCRLCLKSGDCPIDIFDPKGSNGYLVWKIIKEFTEIETSRSDGMPPTICEDCMKKLMDFKYFKKMCIDSRIEFLLHEINNGLVVPMTEDENCPSGGDLCDQGDVHTRDTRNNLEAIGMESEVPIKMEEDDLSEETENVLPNNSWEFMEDGHSELADVESQVTVEKERDECEIHLTPKKDSTVGDSMPSDDEVICLFHVSVPEVKEAVQLKDDQSGPLREDLCGQGDVHAGGTWNNLEARGIESEVTTDEEELMDQEDLCLHLSSSSSDEGSDVDERELSITGPEAEVNDVNCTDEVSVPVDGGIEGLGNTEETLIRERGTDRVKWTGHQKSARKEHDAIDPVATHSHLKQRKLRSHSRNETYGPDEYIESTPQSTSRKLIVEENGKHTKRKEETRTESKHGIGEHAKSISIGSCVVVGKSEGQDFICNVCVKVFRSKDLIKRHLKVPCGSKLVDCGIFSTKCHNRNDYKRHRSLHCVSNVFKRREPRGVAVDVSGESEGKRQIKKRIPATCHICNKEVSHRSALKRHIKTVHLKERKFSCEICGKAFGEKGTLQAHMRYHDGVKPYACSHCQKGFSHSGHLRQHIRAVHEMKKPHTCGECGKAFSQKSSLKAHMLVHSGERPYSCDICSRSFSLKQNLQSHMLIHTGERPHTCDICSRSFSLKQDLKTHMLIHTGEKPHTCTLCSKSFRQIGHLKAHMATHARDVPHP